MNLTKTKAFLNAINLHRVLQDKKKCAIYTSILLVLVLGASLRMYHFSDLARFNEDQVRDAILVDKMVSSEAFPLLGPKAGGTKFNLGPALYYIEYPFALIFGNNPAVQAYPILFGAIFSLLLFFLIARPLFGAWPAVALTAFYATSFYAVKYSKFAWNPNFAPFIILFFIIALSKLTPPSHDKKMFWTIVLGILTGIGMQLHTLLMVTFPLMIVCVFAYRIFKHIPSAKQLLIIFTIILLFFIPVFISEIKTGGENTQQFISGFEGKTSSKTNIAQNVLTNLSCNLQSSSYIITGYNPEDSCVFFDPEKIDSAKLKIAVALVAIFWLCGVILLIRKIRTLPPGNERNLFSLIGLQVLITFLLGIPLAQELSVRLFIVIIHFPFIIVGLLYDFAAEKISKRASFVALFVCCAIVSFVNIQKFLKVYVPRAHAEYTENYELLGGITTGESRAMADYIASHLPDNSRKIYVNNFEFVTSIAYFLQKSNIEACPMDEETAIGESKPFFLIAKTESEKKIKKRLAGATISDSHSFGKFSIFILIPSQK